MATINHSITRITPFGDEAHIILWEEMGDDDEGAQIEMPASTERSIQIEGTFGGATVVLQGSNDGTNWRTLNDPQGNPISKTSAAIEKIQELTRYIRPATSGGSGTDIDVTVLFKKNL